MNDAENTPPADAGATTESAPSPAPEMSAAEQCVRQWFNQHIANSPVSRSVEAINYFTEVALPALIASLEKKD